MAGVRQQAPRPGARSSSSIPVAGPSSRGPSLADAPSGWVPLLEGGVRECRHGGCTATSSQLLRPRPVGWPPGEFGMFPGANGPRSPAAGASSPSSPTTWYFESRKPSHEVFRLFPGPGFPGRPARPAAGGAAGHSGHRARKDPLDVPRIEPVGQLLGQRPHSSGAGIRLPGSRGGISARRLRSAPPGSMPEQTLKRIQSRLAGRCAAW